MDGKKERKKDRVRQTDGVDTRTPQSPSLRVFKRLDLFFTFYPLLFSSNPLFLLVPAFVSVRIVLCCGTPEIEAGIPSPVEGSVQMFDVQIAAKSNASMFDVTSQR